MYLNEITNIDLAKSTFGADFYLWERFAHDATPDSADPTDLVFDNLVGGRFDRAHPAETSELPDGTEYRLWRVQGEFRNDFDLHRFPLDRQTLRLPFFNARAAADRVIYVLDRRSVAVGRSILAPAPQSGGVMTAAAQESSAMRQKAPGQSRKVPARSADAWPSRRLLPPPHSESSLNGGRWMPGNGATIW